MSVSRGNAGFALVAAVFLLVVLAAAALALVRMVAAEQQSVSLSLQQARAYHAARSGIEWGLRAALEAGACPAATTLALAEGGLRGFFVDVTCSRTEHAEAGRILPVYRLESVATYGIPGSPDHVRRRIGATAVDEG